MAKKKKKLLGYLACNRGFSKNTKLKEKAASSRGSVLQDEGGGRHDLGDPCLAPRGLPGLDLRSTEPSLELGGDLLWVFHGRRFRGDFTKKFPARGALFFGFFGKEISVEKLK